MYMTLVRKVTKDHVDSLFDLGIMKKNLEGWEDSPHGKYGSKMILYFFSFS